MKLALIPPYCLVRQIQLTDYQLMLPDGLRNEDYAKAYYAAVARGDYVILDNGAAEGSLWAPQGLMAVAEEFGVSEIVVPDHIKDAELTAQEARAWKPDNNFRHMVVVQGRSADECLWMVEHIDDLDWVTTLGLPRHLGRTTGQKDIRLLLAFELYQRYGDRYDLHFLGAQPNWPNELVYAANAYGDFIRGMDTSMPYNYGHYSELVTDELMIRRPKNYFELPIDEFDAQIVAYNVDTMLGWSRA